MKKLRISAFALLSVLILGLLAVLPISASEGNGVTVYSPNVKEDDCPLIIEKAIVTFDLPELPSFKSLKKYQSYTSKVTAEYHIYNPSDSEVTATLMLPLGREPYAQFYAESGGKKNGVDEKKYVLKINGERITPELRHKGGTRLIEDEYAVYDYYYPDAVVTVCTYTVSGIVGKTGASAIAAMELPEKGIQTDGVRLFIPNKYGDIEGEDGIRRESVEVKNGDIFKVYLIGSESPELPPWYVYSEDSIRTGERIEGEVMFVKSEQITFRDLALMNWTPESGIKEVDWYNAIAIQFERETEYYNMRFDLADELDRWYIYEITLKPGERIVHTVTVPCYPRSNSKYSPSIYTYNYSSPSGWKWAENTDVEVCINTPYYMVRQYLNWFAVKYTTDSYPGEYERTENGFLARLGENPSVLTFTLSKSEDPKQDATGLKAIISILFVVALGKIVTWIGAIVSVIVIIVFIVKSIKTKRKSRSDGQ